MCFRDRICRETIVALVLAILLFSPHAHGQSVGLPTPAPKFLEARARTTVSPAERVVTEVSKDARMALGAQAAASRRGDWPAWERATRRLVTLNDQLRFHSRNKVGTQLAKLKKTIEARLERARQWLGTQAKSAELAVDTLGPLSDASAGQSELAIPIAQRLLAQQIQLPVQQGVAFGGGGPGANAAQAAGLGGQQADYADDLIALIEGTISADIWQSVGGPATIAYYQPALAMVISAPGDVHDGVVDLLYQLRRANGP